jgi:flagellar hook-associated protein 3 FlgL
MTRISTYTQNFAATSGIFQAQRDIALATQQASSQKKADDLKGFGAEATGLIGSHSMLERLAGQADLVSNLRSRLELQDAALGELSAAATDVRLAITDALAIDKGIDVSSRIDAAFKRALGALNSRFAGEAVFNGTDPTANPVLVTSIDGLAATAATVDAFALGDQRRSVQLGDQPAQDLAPRAKEIATELFDLMRSFRQFETSPGNAFGFSLTATQRTYLSSILPAAQTAENVTIAAQSNNGAVQKTVDNALEALNARRDVLDKITGDKENVDLAEVATRLSAAQTQLATASQVFATVKGLSLLDFLR